METFRLSRTAIEEFKLLYEQEFGQFLSDEEAYALANQILDLFKILCQVRNR